MIETDASKVLTSSKSSNVIDGILTSVPTLTAVALSVPSVATNLTVGAFVPETGE